MRVLAVVPTLGVRTSSLRRTLESLRSQDCCDLDIVIVTPRVDDPAVRSLADEHGASLKMDPGKGLTPALSVGLAAASGQDVFMWLNDDDVLTPGSMAATTRRLFSGESIVMVYGNIQYVDESGRLLATSRLGPMAQRIMAYGPNLVPQPGSVARLASVVAVGGLDDSLSFAPDLDLFLRLKQAGKLTHIGRTVAKLMWQDATLTAGNRQASLREAELVRQRYRGPVGRILGLLADSATRLIVTNASRRLSSRARSQS